VRLPTPSVDNRPDNFWPWGSLRIDENRFDQLDEIRQNGRGSWWPFLIGAVLGVLLLIATA